MAPPRILLTVPVVARQADPANWARRVELYVQAVRRAGGEPAMIDATAADHDRRAAFDTMDGLLLTGGADIDPRRYGQEPAGAQSVEPDRDELEATAWQTAATRDLPVLGICRGFEAINVFSGGRLVQHVNGHRGVAWGEGSALTHPIRLVPGTRLARLLATDDEVVVNSYHHQGIRPRDLAPAWSPARSGERPMKPS